VQSRRELFGWVQPVGMSALSELFEADVAELAKLLPQPHSEAVIRAYLAEIQRRLQAR